LLNSFFLLSLSSFNSLATPVKAAVHAVGDC